MTWLLKRRYSRRAVRDRVFTGVRVTVGDRTDIFSCIELPGGRNPLVGVIMMETLGLQPDVINHRLLFLPRNETGSYVTA